MKYTLKNRPPTKHPTKNFKDNLYCFEEMVDEWFEGFEKELQEIKEKYDEDPYEMYCRAGVSEVIREILGEGSS